MTNFNDIDFKLLRFIRKNEPVHIDVIKSAHPKIDSVELRVDEMTRIKYEESRALPGARYPINSPLVVHRCENKTETGIFETTEYGKKALQDYQYATRKYKKEMWQKNWYLPLLATIGFNLLTYGIKMLLPQILEWFSSVL